MRSWATGLSRSCARLEDLKPGRFDGQSAERPGKGTRRRHRKMRRQRGLIGPFLHKDQAQRVFHVLVHRMGQAAGLGTRAPHMLQAQRQRLLQVLILQHHAARHDDHLFAPVRKWGLTRCDRDRL
jgi:hypothetical protein